MDTSTMKHKCIPLEIYDADSITKVDIYVGFGTTRTDLEIRLANIDAPEMRGGSKKSKQLALLARDKVRELALNKVCYIKTIDDKKDPWDRYIGELYTEDGLNINQYLLDNKYVIKFKEKWTAAKVQAGLKNALEIQRKDQMLVELNDSVSKTA